MGEEEDLTGTTLIYAADDVVDLVERQEEIDGWLRKEFYKCNTGSRTN